jgi:hypothetical protein
MKSVFISYNPVVNNHQYLIIYEITWHTISAIQRNDIVDDGLIIWAEFIDPVIVDMNGV